MDNAALNLARAWRSKTFDEIIGQDLAVRLVKNSLFKQQLFPVYLLAGQRGCGKTTLGRVFAAAINCALRDSFSQCPHEVALPCLACPSCTAMRNGAHPDFYEIDAASHTGVDNVRGLIEAASFLPVLGAKKIYLIDEAHMLSKAAFNAFLKILEEPPARVVFMLATTDPHKILDTVRSRCFQLFLNPIEVAILQQHLSVICQKEGLPYEDEALLAIALEAEGSVRDALDLLERLRLGYDVITSQAVLSIQGDIGYEAIFDLFEAAFTAPPAVLLANLEKASIKQHAGAHLWKKMAEALRALIGACVGTLPAAFMLYHNRVSALARKLSLEQLVETLELWYHLEPLFLKTQLADVFVEMALLQVNQKFLRAKTNAQPESPPIIESRQAQTAQPKDQAIAHTLETAPWQQFIERLKKEDDPLVLSIFRQAAFIGYQVPSVKVRFGQNLVFFKELLVQTTTVWQPLLAAIFGNEALLDPEFTDSASIPPQKINSEVPRPRLGEQQKEAHQVTDVTGTLSAPAQKAASSRLIGQDLKNSERWKKVHTVLRIFPGIVTEERGS